MVFVREFLVLATITCMAGVLLSFLTRKKFFLTWTLASVVLIAASYFSFSFWVFMFAILVIWYVFIHGKPERTKICYLMVLLPMLPNDLQWVIPFPGISFLMHMNHVRLITALVCFPIFLKYIKSTDEKLFKYRSDFFVLPIIGYMAIFNFDSTSVTSGLRQNVYLFLDYFLFYFVISRTTKSLQNVQSLIYPIMFTATFLGGLALFETLKHWHMYLSLPDLLGGIDYGIVAGGHDLVRAGRLRAFGSFMQPIPLGIFFYIAIVLTYLLQLFTSRKMKIAFWAVMAIALIGLIVCFSRTPLMGLVVFGVLYVITSSKNNLKRLIRNTVKLSPLILVGGILMSATPLGQSFLKTIPGIGKEGKGTIGYRERLFEVSMNYLKTAPLTGDPHFLESEKLDLRSGHLKIDITNTYLQIALRYGIIGVVLYIFCLWGLLFQVYRTMGKTSDEFTRQYGQTLFSAFASLLIVLSSVSFIAFLPLYVFSIIGMVGAYIQSCLNQQRLTSELHHKVKAIPGRPEIA